MSSISGVPNSTVNPQVSSVSTVSPQSSTSSTTTVQYSYLGIPYVPSVAGLNVPSAPEDTQALIMLIIANVNQMVGQTRGYALETSGQRAQLLVAAIKQMAQEIFDAAAAIHSSDQTITINTYEISVNTGRINERYAHLTGSSSQTDFTKVTPAANGSQGIYGVFKDLASSYFTAKSSYDTALSTYNGALGAKAADQATLGQNRTALTGELGGLLANVNASPFSDAMAQAMLDKLGPNPSGPLAAALKFYIQQYPTATAQQRATLKASTLDGYFSTLTSIKNTLGGNGDLSATDIATINNYINPNAANSTLASALNSYEASLNKLNTTNYQGAIDSALTGLAQARATLHDAEVRIAPYLDRGATAQDGSSTPFTDPIDKRVYTLLTLGTDAVKYQQTGLIGADYNLINQLIATNNDLQAGIEAASTRKALGKATLDAKAAVLLAQVAAEFVRLDSVTNDKSKSNSDGTQDDLGRVVYEKLAAIAKRFREIFDVANQARSTNPQNPGTTTAPGTPSMLPVQTGLALILGLAQTFESLASLAVGPGNPDSTQARTGGGARVRVPA